MWIYLFSDYVLMGKVAFDHKKHIFSVLRPPGENWHSMVQSSGDEHKK